MWNFFEKIIGEHFKKLLLLIIVVLFFFCIIFYLVYLISKEGTVIDFGLFSFTKDHNEHILKNCSSEKSYSKKEQPFFLLTNEQIDNLSDNQLRKYLGQIFIVGFSGKSLSDNNDISRQLIEKYGIGGLIFYQRNFFDKSRNSYRNDNVSTLIKYINNQQNISLKCNKSPLFISNDFEGGNTSHLTKKGITSHLPSPMAVAAIHSPNAAFISGSIIGSEMSNIGFNMNFAPLLDVSTSDTNNVIQERSFGEDPIMVNKLAERFIDGLNISKVIAVAKHFPGHGTTSAGFDSPGLPSCIQSFNVLKTSIEPFRLLNINKKINAIMTSHMSMPIINKLLNRPDNFDVSMSKIIIDKLLRSGDMVYIGKNKIKGLGFNGLIISDDLLIPCINSIPGESEKNINNYVTSVKNNILKSFDAGHNLLMLSHIFSNKLCTSSFLIKKRKKSEEKFRWSISLDEFDEIYKFLEKNIFFINDNELRMARIAHLKDSLKKIFALKKFINIDAITNFDQSRVIENFQKIKRHHKQCADELFRRSFTVIKSIDGYIPLANANIQNKILIFMPSRFNSYRGIKLAKSEKNYPERLKNNVEAFYFTKELQDKFQGKTNLVFELEKLNPASVKEYQDRVSDIIKIIDEVDPFIIVFLINKRSRWFLLQRLLFEINKNNLIPLNRITAVINNDVTMLRSKYPDYKYSIQFQELLKKINILIAYSGYGYRASLFWKTVKDNSINENSSRLPIDIKYLNVLPDYLLDQSFDCSVLKNGQQSH